MKPYIPRPPGATVHYLQRRECRCGYWFIPKRPQHWQCETCYRWHLVGWLTATTKRQFDRLRELR